MPELITERLRRPFRRRLIRPPSMTTSRPYRSPSIWISPNATEIVDYTRSLPRLWADSGADGKQALVGAVFAKLDVLGFQRLEYELTPDAMDLGLDAALAGRDRARKQDW